MKLRLWQRKSGGMSDDATKSDDEPIDQMGTLKCLGITIYEMHKGD